MTKQQPRTLIEAIRYFADLDVATDFVADLRWDGTPICDRCGSVESYHLAKRRVWKCKGCARQYSVKVGTIFEDSALGLDKWLPAVWLIANSKNGISSHELGRALGVTQKSAWFMLHRIRLAMAAGSFDKLDGTVEADETFIGGLTKNMHAVQRAEKNVQGGTTGKTAVAGVLSRDGEVRATVIPNTSGRVLQSFVRANVKKHATLYTDARHAYRALGEDFDHAIVDHHLNQYVNGNVHTNGIESFWALLKRGIKGAYVNVSPSHLIRYVDERVFTFNNRKDSDFDRFASVLTGVANRRLTYVELTGKS